MLHLTQSMQEFLLRKHTDLLAPLIMGHIELYTEEIAAEYNTWVMTQLASKHELSEQSAEILSNNELILRSDCLQSLRNCTTLKKSEHDEIAQMLTNIPVAYDVTKSLSSIQDALAEECALASQRTHNNYEQSNGYIKGMIDAMHIVAKGVRTNESEDKSISRSVATENI